MFDSFPLYRLEIRGETGRRRTGWSEGPTFVAPSKVWGVVVGPPIPSGFEPRRISECSSWARTDTFLGSVIGATTVGAGERPAALFLPDTRPE